ncbi:MAG: hypothetical protein JWM98_1760 [Thermoleophilia bacterium]|nr:hypothetical protein [Thermoleophilia bacterium]
MGCSGMSAMGHGGALPSLPGNPTQATALPPVTTTTAPPSLPAGGAALGATSLGGGAAAGSIENLISQLTAAVDQLRARLQPGAGVAGGGRVAPVTPTTATGTAAKPVHTSIHGTVLAATGTSLTLRDDAGVTRSFAIDPKDLPALDMAHLTAKHVATGKTLDLVYSNTGGVLHALGYSHPPSVPPAAPSAVPHSAIHGTVVKFDQSSITIKDDSGADATYAIRAADVAALDLAHLAEKHSSGKALNLVFQEVDGVKYAISYNHPDVAPPPVA